MKLFDAYLTILLVLTFVAVFSQERFYVHYDYFSFLEDDIVFSDTLKKVDYSIDKFGNFDIETKQNVSINPELRYRSAFDADIFYITRNLNNKSFLISSNNSKRYYCIDSKFYRQIMESDKMFYEVVNPQIFYVNDNPIYILDSKYILVATNKGIICYDTHSENHSELSAKDHLSEIMNFDSTKIVIDDQTTSTHNIAKRFKCLSFAYINNRPEVYDTDNNVWHMIRYDHFERGYSFKRTSKINPSTQIDYKSSISFGDFEHKSFIHPNKDTLMSNVYHNIAKNTFAKLEIFHRSGTKEIVFKNYEYVIPVVSPDGSTIYINDRLLLARKNGKAVLMTPDGDYYESDTALSNYVMSKYKPSFFHNAFFTISLFNNGFKLLDKTSTFQMIDIEFDKISFIDHYILVKSGTNSFIYNSRFQELIIPAGFYAGLFYNCPQLVAPSNDTIFYLHYEGSLHQEPEKYEGILHCGNMNIEALPIFRRLNKDSCKLDYYSSNFFLDENDLNLNQELSHGKYTFFLETDSIKNIVTVDYANKDANNYYQYYPLDISYDGHPFAYYKNGKSGVCLYSPFGNYRFKIYAEYDFNASYYYRGDQHPILFEYEGKLGYVEVNDRPFASSLSDFNLAFARYTLPSGKKGWVDRDGNRFE